MLVLSGGEPDNKARGLAVGSWDEGDGKISFNELVDFDDALFIFANEEELEGNLVRNGHLEGSASCSHCLPVGVDKVVPNLLAQLQVGNCGRRDGWGQLSASDHND